jgi:hypothetical protein
MSCGDLAVCQKPALPGLPWPCAERFEGRPSKPGQDPGSLVSVVGITALRSARSTGLGGAPRGEASLPGY